MKRREKKMMLNEIPASDKDMPRILFGKKGS
jgi:hypothetical protein